MKTINIEELKKYEKFLYNRGRDIEIAKFNYHFNDGSKEDVAMALSIYQNRDGGFGHGLEPDSLNPYSSPLQTSEALKILKHIGYDENNQDDVASYLINRALHYIYYYCLKDGKINPNVPSNNDYPHAKWWEYDENFFEKWRYNPTAVLVALTLHFTNSENKYYKKAFELIPTIIESFISDTKENVDKHYLNNMMELYDVITKKNLFTEYHEALYNNINKRIDDLITLDESIWNDDISNQPIELIQFMPFLNTEERKELIERNLDFLLDSRDANGLFEVTWNWGNDYDEFELQKIKWAGVILVNNLIFLKRFNRIIK